MKVYVLHHVYEPVDRPEEVKLIGIFSSEDLARSAIGALSHQSGFSEHRDGFEINEWQVDRIGWAEGFVVEEC